ncbi:thiamine-phosphate kinase [Sporohalobacter salinus]|uniref:thiamine-phosphate kinase n=1 Tax=Sporohalobacter salinus TaxID=1494606 RepID=UPI00195F358B|nr:thiamine-phosphate kinase [Sporohalobacter salinus]MBM7623945.1 thiamine-monophosphate kinase [Sporohalobacter salinus]
MNVSDLNEFQLINHLQKIITSNSTKIEVGNGDDGAVINNTPGYQTINTTDMLIEGVHFLRNKISSFDLGYKSLAINISDIVAMGGVPTYATISLGLPPNIEVEYIEEIYQGLNNLAQQYNINIIGGDTTSSPKNLIININLLGKVKENKYLLRSTAQIGNHILVTGTLGDSKAGLEIILNNNYQQLKKEYPALTKKHFRPIPRLQEMKLIKKLGATAMNDISDGLASELNEITTASQVGAQIFADKLPISQTSKELAAKLDMSAKDYALFGGEDYELLFTAPANKSKKIKVNIENKLDTKISIIGEILPPQQETKLITPNKTIKLMKEGFKHF